MGGVPPLKGDPAGADVVVVGGGPGGMTAAAAAAGAGADVVLLEGEERPGKKLLLTGRGRCNLTSTLPLEQFLEAYGPNGRFLRNAFGRFFSGDLIRHLATLGVETARERGGRIYPVGGGAGGVCEALVRHLSASGVQLQTRRRVRRLERLEKGGFLVAGSGFAVVAGRVILATGGASYPWTGSRGDGYSLAEGLGHTVEAPRPALVPVCCSEPFVRRLEGLRLRNVNLFFRSGGKRRKESFGEVHFTAFGISGPAVFPVSQHIGILAGRNPLPLQIDLKPALDEETLDRRLLRELAADGRRRCSKVVESLLPRKLVPVFLALAQVPPSLPAAEVTRGVRRRLLLLLKAFPVTATGTLPLERGMVTAGGVRLSEVEPVTMESRIVPGLFFCGELLDLDGSTGGFNLQAAFSTGILAGRAAAGGTTEKRRRG